ncbi:MAG: ABC transporter permease [Holophagales bacterium]|nr:ABC transporter permease [Holophagales bacterium]
MRGSSTGKAHEPPSPGSCAPTRPRALPARRAARALPRPGTIRGAFGEDPGDGAGPVRPERDRPRRAAPAPRPGAPSRNRRPRERRPGAPSSRVAHLGGRRALGGGARVRRRHAPGRRRRDLRPPHRSRDPLRHGVVQAFPALVLVAAGAALVPPSAMTAVLLIALTGWPEVARLVRAEALRLSASPYVEAARAAGASRRRVLLVHVLPGAVAPALATVPYVLGGAVLLEASLSFLGLGTPPPTASWGRALADARESLTSAWWCVVPPAAALFLFVLSARKLGEALSESR